MSNVSYRLKACSSGFSLVEIVLASAVFALLVTALVGSYIYGQEATVLAGKRARAVMVAEAGIEAVKNIADENFNNLIDGTYGLEIIGNQWALSGTSDTTDIFTRQINISSVDASRKEIVSEVTWQQNEQRNGVVAINTRLTNWRAESGSAFCTEQADKLVIDSTTAILGAGNKELQNVNIENTDTTCDIVIDRVTVSWDNAQNMERIRIGNTNVWSGSAVSGTEIDITDQTIANADGQIGTSYRFSGNMNGATFSITFVLGDGTEKSVSGISP